MPATTSTHPGRSRGRRPVVIASIIAGSLIVLLGIAYVVAHVLAQSAAPRNASVNGVAIGGLTSDEAVSKLTAELGPADSAAFTLTGQDGQSATIVPADAGLTVDYRATVRHAGVGAGWDPRDLIHVLTGGGETSPVVTVEQDELSSALAGVADAFVREPVDAGLSLAGTEVVRTPAVPGTALDDDATAQTVEDAWRAAVDRPVTDPREPFSVGAELATATPRITDEVADEVAADLATTLRPITVTTPHGQVTVTAEQLASVTDVTATDGALSATVDLGKLYDTDTVITDELTVVEPQDASVELRDGVPTVVPAVDGQSVTREAFVQGLEGVSDDPEPREVALEVTGVPAGFTTQDAENLGIREVVGEFTTYFPASQYRNTNLGLAAAGIMNTLVKPGETFSLAEATGPRDASTGYVDGAVLVGDHLEYVVGGGVSQVATTTYNAAFFAGMTDIEHHPHTQYFSRYPAGREATVYEGVLDLQFRNDTPYGVLMEAWITPSIPGEGSITVRVWSTQYYDSVTATTPETWNYVNGTTKTSDSAECVPQSAAPGFDVSYQRILVLGGQQSTEDYFWRYSPIDQITCTAS
ncbi:VanW family protein [Brooklawnia cerclae]|uniref:Vancomycin resistance protein YoaR n=1 Tax=Brooklawnia cerclae TaxID=349934 RepID=A0ABX0SGY8_9ACTN|nr:VanW family protein [Brooklawnia cerclae]NIH57663.1 vancomycin resistance protein YoaR [Brooklawnia cerclae]